jgi:ATP-binding cassette subfamily B protein
MMPKIYAAIEDSISKGVPPQYLAENLKRQGWPPLMVDEAVKAWLSSHGRLQSKTDFKTWLKKYKRRALGATITMILVSVLSSSVLLLQPWPTKILVDSGFGNVPAPGPLHGLEHKPAMILATSILTIAIFLVGFFLNTVRDYLVLRLGFGLNRQIKEESFRHILHLPLYHQARLPKGDYIYRQNILTSSLADLVLDTTSLLVESVIMIVGVLIIMMNFNMKLTLISVVLIPFLFFLIKVFGPRLGHIAQKMTEIASETSSTITESIDNAETVQAFTLEEKQIAKANYLWWQSFRLSRRSLLWGRSYRFSNSILIILGTSAVMYYGGTAALNGTMTLGQLLIFMTYMGYLLGPVEAVATEIAARNQKIIDVSRVYEVLTDHEGIEYSRKDNHIPTGKGQIEFQNVTYSYNDTTVLKGINLKIDSGQKVGIIGPSGGGKSTLLKLMPLFIEPSSGRVMIDGIDVQTVSLSELRKNVVWISQNPQLFDGTILDNLLDADTGRQIEQTEIEAAIQAANVEEFTSRLPLGLRTPAGEGGNSLSGGQKQRIAIARGLIKNAPIVCMDEPTAALDSKSENTIRDSISHLIAGKTVVMVTHRKALLSLMDVIYVMDGGSLHGVDEYGGLDSYLQKISDTEGSEEKKAALVEQEAMAAIARLQAENQQLQEKLSAPPPIQSATSDVTVAIQHEQL